GQGHPSPQTQGASVGPTPLGRAFVHCPDHERLLDRLANQDDFVLIGAHAGQPVVENRFRYFAWVLFVEKHSRPCYSSAMRILSTPIRLFRKLPVKENLAAGPGFSCPTFGKGKRREPRRG